MGHWFSNFTLDQSKSVPIFDDFWRIDIDFRRISLISSRARVPCWWIMSLNINKMPHLNSIIIQLKQTVLSDKWIFNHLNASGNKPWWKSMMQQCFLLLESRHFRYVFRYASVTIPILGPSTLIFITRLQFQTVHFWDRFSRYIVSDHWISLKTYNTKQLDRSLLFKTVHFHHGKFRTLFLLRS